MMFESGDGRQRDHEGRVIDFGRAAADYERFRPGFPDTLFERFLTEGWRGRIRTCHGVGSALGTEQVEHFDADLAAMLAERFPRKLNVLHRLFAVSGVTSQP